MAFRTRELHIAPHTTTKTPADYTDHRGISLFPRASTLWYRRATPGRQISGSGSLVCPTNQDAKRLHQEDYFPTRPLYCGCRAHYCVARRKLFAKADGRKRRYYDHALRFFNHEGVAGESDLSGLQCEVETATRADSAVSNVVCRLRNQH